VDPTRFLVNLLKSHHTHTGITFDSRPRCAHHLEKIELQCFRAVSASPAGPATV